MAKKKRIRRKATRSAKRKTTRRAARKTTRKKTGRSKVSRGGLRSASFVELKAEINRREHVLTGLDSRRARLIDQLGEVDQEIMKIGPRATFSPAVRIASGSGRTRGKNSMNLVGALQRVLSVKTLSVSDSATAVKKIGYHTKSENFRTIVNQALLANPKSFKKVSRGMYTVKA